MTAFLAVNDKKDREKLEYTELNKTVKKKRRRLGKDHERNNHVEIILQSGRGSKQPYKGGPKKKMCEMQNEDNKVQTDRNENLKICACFYLELYNSTFEDQRPSLKNLRLIRSSTDHDIRSQENLERNEKQQGPGRRQPDK